VAERWLTPSLPLGSQALSSAKKAPASAASIRVSPFEDRAKWHFSQEKCHFASRFLSRAESKPLKGRGSFEPYRDSRRAASTKMRSSFFAIRRADGGLLLGLFPSNRKNLSWLLVPGPARSWFKASKRSTSSASAGVVGQPQAANTAASMCEVFAVPVLLPLASCSWALDRPRPQ
jgi:hypothetical protein